MAIPSLPFFRCGVLAFVLFACAGSPALGEALGGALGDGDFAVGEFVVQWRTDGGAGGGGWLRVTRAGSPHRVLWSTAHAGAFLAAGRAEPQVRELRGSFRVTENVRSLWTDQTVDGAWRAGAALVLAGTLDRGRVAYRLRFAPAAVGHLSFAVDVDDPGCNFLRIGYDSDGDERFYGFGEQFSVLDHKGREVPVLSQENGIGRGHPVITPIMELLSAGSGGHDYSTYFAAPHYLTNRSRSVFLENSEYSVFDLRAAEVVRVRLFAGRMRGRILAGDRPLELIERYTAYAGRMARLPDWLNAGAVVGMQGGTAAVRRVRDALRARGAPVAAWWLQDWVGQRRTAIGSQLWWNWELDRERYPGWEDLVATLRSDGARVLGYVNPFLVDARSKGGVKRDLYGEAAALGYLVRDREGRPYAVANTDFSAGILDLSNPAARTWFKRVLWDQVLGAGLSGWMADFGEALPFDASLASGESAAAFHNHYPEEWARLNREAIREAGREGDAVFFTRSGFTRSPGLSTLFWTGDQTVTWDRYDGFQSALQAVIGGGFSGLALNHFDIGGYTSISAGGVGWRRERELLLRAMEASAFTAVFRTHEGNQPEANAQFDDDAGTLDAFARWAKVYAALAPYRRTLFDEAASRGWPVVRHPFLHYPGDPVAQGLRDQFLLGREFLVAPVVQKHATRRRLYLPPGDWTHLWTGAAFSAPAGRWIDVDAPLGRPPVFFRAGSSAGAALVSELRRRGVLP